MSHSPQDKSEQTPRAKEALGDAVDYYAQIIESITSGVIAVDRDGVVLTVNSAACMHLNIPDAQLHPGVRFDALQGLGHFVDVVREMMRTQQPISRREIPLDTPQGKKIMGMTASLLQGPEPFNGVAFLFTDLTEVRELERTAQLSRQLAQIGELTAGVVHELRNPVGVISGMAELLIRKLGQEERLRQKAEAIFQEAEHLEKLIAQFLSFAKPFDLEKSRCAPEVIFQRALQLCTRLAEKRGIEVKTDCSADLPAIAADTTKLAQALANIVRNGIEVTPAGGEVHVSGRIEGTDLVFEVEDGGPGVHLNEGDDLFSPFFSKKEGGTGLGLSIVHRIVSAHQGTVHFANRDGGGARFEIRVPIEPPG